MKPIYEWSQSPRTTIYAPYLGKPPFTTSVDTTLNDVRTMPIGGVNPGNFQDPTAWEYSINAVRRYTGCKVEYYLGREYSRVIGCYGGDPLSGPTWERDSLYNEALEKLNDKVRHRADWGEDLAVPSRTAELGNLAEAATDLARDLRRNPIKAVSDGYLMFRYGWQPLIQNIYDTALAQLNDTSGNGMVLRSAATRTIRSSTFVTNGGSGTGDANAVLQNLSGVQGCRIVVRMRGMSSGDLSDFVTNNPAYLAWNLIPYSFVVDWFYNIGGWLEAQEQALRYNPYFLSGYMTELYSCRNMETVTDKWSGSSFLIQYGKAYRRDVRFVRTKLSGWPLPRRPVLNTDLGSSHLLAAAALLGSLLGR